MTGQTTCFMHVQKCGGTSVRTTIEAGLPPGSLAPRRMEPANFACFDDFDGLSPEARALVAVGEAELRELGRYPVICGHITLPTLERFAPSARIATVLREPRTRLLSYYLHLRTNHTLRTSWSHYGVHRFAEGSLAEMLADPRVARMTDNRACRMVLHGDPRIRDGEFIAKTDLDELAEETWKRLETLGFVGIVEEPAEAWRGVGRVFGVELEPVRANVTGANGVAPGTLPAPPLGGSAALELLERRSAADAIVYRRVVARRRGEQDARRFADAAFAEGLVRYGSFTSPALAELEDERRAAVLTRDTLEQVMGSRSWRLTAPLRRGRAARRDGE